MNHYEPTELLPIVAMLTKKYTRNESSSVSYEKAEQLMGAVLYCIHEYELSRDPDRGIKRSYATSKSDLIAINDISAKEAYEIGYRMVKDKVEHVRTLYNEMILHFNAYGNENYRDTVEKGIPGFLKLYDPRFAPQDTILTLDYPTIRPIRGLQGVDAIEQYLKYILLEEEFMGRLPENRVIEILTNDHSDYRKQFYNLCGIVLRELLGRNRIRIMMEQKMQPEQMQSEAFHHELVNQLTSMLKKLIWEHYDENGELLDYLKYAIKDLCTELETGYGCTTTDFGD